MTTVVREIPNCRAIRAFGTPSAASLLISAQSPKVITLQSLSAHISPPKAFSFRAPPTVASGSLLVDFRANAAAEGAWPVADCTSLQHDRSSGCEGDVAGSTLPATRFINKQWLKAIEELESDGLSGPIVPDVLFDEEDQEHNHTIWRLSDGTDGAEGGWTSGNDPLEYITDPEPLGGPGTAPAPDPALYARYPVTETAAGTTKRNSKAKAKK